MKLEDIRGQCLINRESCFFRRFDGENFEWELGRRDNN